MEPLTFDAIEAAIKKITDGHKPPPKMIINPWLQNSRVVIKSGNSYYVCKDFVPAQCEKIIDIGEGNLEPQAPNIFQDQKAKIEYYFGGGFEVMR